MRRWLPMVVLVVGLGLLVAPLAWAASSASAATVDKSPAAPLAGALSTVTGIAISPLLGTGAYGAYRWATAKDAAARAALPWFAQVAFWLPALLLVGACAAKDAFGATLPPGWKKPLDVLETVENQATGLVAAGAVVPLTMMALSKMVVGADPTAATGLVPSGVAMLAVGTFDVSWLLNVLTIPLGVAVFAVVWLASHAINVLILLSPWGAIDAVLKGARAALLGLITLTATLDPGLGALLSLGVILLACLVAGWALRLTVFGSVFCWDFLTLRRRRFTPRAEGDRIFTGALPGVPVRTYGRLERNAAGGYVFAYRPWLWRPERRAAVSAPPGELAVGCGLFFSSITQADQRTLFLLPPRYRGHEAEVAANYALGGGVRPAGLRRAWGALRELFSGAATRTQLI